MAVEAGEFRIAAMTTKADEALNGPFYFALQGFDDMHAQFAGTVTKPMVVGVPCNYPMEVETDQYTTTDTYAVGDALQIKDGGKVGLKAAGHTIVGIVTSIPAARWVNNAVAVTGYRLGNNVNVIRFATVLIPPVS
jgi:hypothetical protein